MPVARTSAAPLGVVYTPAEVARAMIALVMPRAGMRVCDPAVGEGAFVGELLRHVEARAIYGVDVDARAARAARKLLGIDENVRVGNALEMDWRATFPDVFARGGFDLVIGNPPYIRQELLADKAALRDYECADGVADLYVYFIELAHRIAKPGGRYCFITPNKWLTVEYGRNLRRYLAKQRSVDGVIDLGASQLFAEDAFPCIVYGTVAPSTSPIRAARIDRLPLVEGALHDRARWTDEPWHIDDPKDRALLDRLEQKWPALGTLVGKPSRGIVTGLNRAFVLDRATRDRLLDAEPAAAPLVRPFIKGRDLRPYVPAYADRYILLVDHGTSLDELPHVRAHLAQFRAALEPKPERGDGAGRKPGTYRWYELQDPVGEELAASRAPRLFYQDIQTSPTCCLDETGLVPDTTVWVLPTADKYLLAVLSSPFYGWYARRRFPPALNGAVRPKHDYIRALPIATPTPEQRARIEALVDRRIAGDDCDHAIADAVHDVYEVTAADLS